MQQFRKILLFTVVTLNLIIGVLLLLAAYGGHISPIEHRYLSSFHLTFSILFFINILFIPVYLILKSYKYGIIAASLLLISIPAFHRTCPIHFNSKNVSNEHLTVLSYNIFGFNGCYKTNNSNEILEYIKNTDADIVCLQEYQVADNKRYLTQKDVNRALKKYPYSKIYRIGNSESYNNIACFSKLPIIGSKKIAYKSMFNGSTMYQIKWGKDTINLINNHLESNKLNKDDKDKYKDVLDHPQQKESLIKGKQLYKKIGSASYIRGKQADVIAAVIDSVLPQYTIVCGDFNDTALSYAHYKIGRKLKDAFISAGRGWGISYNRNQLYFRIDHILTSPNLKCQYCIVDNSIKASDHYPIIAKITRN